jgi:hypothetical protein
MVLIQNKNIDAMISNCLLQGKLELLYSISHGSLVGDAAAVASKGILKLLSQQQKGTTEEFLRSVVRTRILDYRISC